MSSLRKRVDEINMTLMGMKIEKTGYHKHKGFKYYELNDILNPIYCECYKKDIHVEFPFIEGVAILKLVDLKDESNYIPYRIELPEIIVPSKNQNNQIIQTVGANITYLKRYLLQLAFPAVSDKDMVDSGVFDENKNSSAKNTKSGVKQEKKEEEVADLQMGTLIVKARDNLVKKGIAEKEITYKMLKQTVLHMQKWTVPERRCILNYFKEKKGGAK